MILIPEAYEVKDNETERDMWVRQAVGHMSTMRQIEACGSGKYWVIRAYKWHSYGKSNEQ